jgi:hypothetical protein
MKVVKKIILFLSLFLIINLNAQENKLRNNLFKVSILSPGLSFEKSISNNSTISSDIGTNIGFNSNNFGVEWLITPYIKEQYRFYYNLEKRENKNKNIYNNSGNFIGFSASYYFNPLGEKDYISIYDGLTLAPTWGLQRAYNSGISFTLNSGFGYNISDNNSNKFVPVINFSVGWIIGK